jgi:hypothetical protein
VVHLRSLEKDATAKRLPAHCSQGKAAASGNVSG